MDYSNFIVLLARQRSGTNAVRSLLESHPQIFCLNEVFNLADKNSADPLVRDTNFFTFLENYAGGNVAKLLPSNHERLFHDYLEYLRCFSPKRYVVIDIKYNTTHFLTKTWSDNFTVPYLFDLLIQNRVRVLNLTRKNYLRFVLSVLKAWRSGQYTLAASEQGLADRRLSLDVAYLLSELHKCHAEDQAAAAHFSSYAGYWSCDYTDIFSSSGGTGVSKFLGQVAEWLEIDNAFDEAHQYFKKQSYLPLAETLENFEQVVAALRGTQFEYCLEDEGVYSAAGTALGTEHDTAPEKDGRVKALTQ